MLTNEEEIEFERLSPAEADPIQVVVEVDDEWKAIKRVPETLYRVDKNYCIDKMAIWALNCHGSKVSTMYGPRERVWIYTLRELIYSGSKYNVLDEERDFDKRYVHRVKGNCFLTLEAAVERLEAARLEHLTTLYELQVRCEDELAVLKKRVEDYKDIQAAASKPLTLASIGVQTRLPKT